MGEGSTSASLKQVKSAPADFGDDAANDDDMAKTHNSSSEPLNELSNMSESNMAKWEPLTRQQKIHYFYFTALYFMQGLTNSYETFSVVYLEERNVSASAAGVGLGVSRIAILARIACGLMADKYDLLGFGHRKPYMFIGLLLSSAMYFGVAILEIAHESLDTTSFTLIYFALFFGVQSSFVFYDSAGDGFITECIPGPRAGQIQGYMNAGRGFGAVLGFVLFGLLAEGPGWRIVFFIEAIAHLVLLPGLYWLKEVDEEDRMQFEWKAFHCFKRKRVQLACFYVFWVNIPSAMALFLLPLFVTYLGFGTVLNSVALGIAAVFVAVSAPVGGYLMDKYRTRLEWPFCAGILFGVFAVLGFLFCELESNLVFLFAAVGGTFVGILLALNFALVMITAETGIEGSFFAIMNTCWTLGDIISLAFVGALLDETGFLFTWGFGAFLLIVTIPYVVYFFRTDREGRRQEAAQLAASLDGEDAARVKTPVDLVTTKVEDIEFSSVELGENEDAGGSTNSREPFTKAADEDATQQQQGGDTRPRTLTPSRKNSLSVSKSASRSSGAPAAAKSNGEVALVSSESESVSVNVATDPEMVST